MPKRKGNRRKRCRRHEHRNGNGRIRLGKGSLRFQLSAIVEISRDFCPVCGVPIGSPTSWHRHLFGDNREGPKCPTIRKWLERRKPHRRYRRPQTYPAS